MKKKILCLAMTVIMAAGVHTTAFAKDYQGADGWQVNFTGGKMDSNFKSSDVTSWQISSRVTASSSRFSLRTPTVRIPTGT